MNTAPTHTRTDQTPAPLEIAFFLFKHLGEVLKHVVMKVPGGEIHWGYFLEVETSYHRIMLVRGVASVETYFCGEHEIQAYMLHDNGKRVLFYDGEDIDPESTALRDALLTLESAPKLDLFVWKGDTTIYNGDGEPEYGLLNKDPGSRYVEMIYY